MKTPIELLEQHRSERDFDGYKLTPKEIEVLIKSTQRAPSSMNAQLISVLTVQDDDILGRISETIGQHFIKSCGLFAMFLADYNKMDHVCKIAQVKPEMHNRVEALMTASVDAGIQVQSMSLSAQSLGFGTCMIGAVRKNPLKISEIVGLPDKVFPVVGLAVGRVLSSAAVKPRLPLDAFWHDGKYSDSSYDLSILEYDKTLRDHWIRTSRTEGLGYSEKLGERWSSNYYPEVFVSLRCKGFGLE